jgi:formate dehydrogenase major subunit
MVPAIEHMGVNRTRRTVLAMNQKDGFDCPSCAWPDPHHRKAFEFCEEGAKAVTWEATPVVIASEFWAEHSVSDLRSRSEYWLGMQGRLTEPVYKPAGEDYYRPITWNEAIELVATRLNALGSPDEAAFYTSGRTSNEAAFLYQLFVRGYGTNNLPDCSNMCHESSGWGMGQTIGVGKATVTFDDFAAADLIILMGQNPGTNHPRMLNELEACKRNGGSLVAVNPLPEAGLKRYKNPQTVRGVAGKGTELADQFLQIRLGGDMALLQAVSKRVLDAEARNPGTVLDHKFLAEHCEGLEELKEHLAQLDEQEVLEATGLRIEEIDELAERYLKADKVIITWAMGITQQKKGVATIKEIINLLLLRGNIGKPGAGASPSAATATCRAIAPWASGSRCRRHSWTPSGRSSTSNLRGGTVPTPSKRSAECRKERSSSSWPSGKPRGGDLRHCRSGSGDGKDRLHCPDLHQAQPVPRIHRERSAHPAHHGSN